MNFDELDIEPKNEPSADCKSSSKDSEIHSKEEKDADDKLQTQLLQRTVPLDNGSIGYVFTCTKNGPLATWRCHVCNFVDTWESLKRHLDAQWHDDNMFKHHHSSSNFSKVEIIMADFSRGQPLPPGVEDETAAGACQILKTLETYEHPLIGLEFLLELHSTDESKEPRYFCLLCSKRGDSRIILVHLTSQKHYLLYLKKYFCKFYSLIDELPKSKVYRVNVSNVTSHLIAKLEEKYGRLQPTVTREDMINSPGQLSIILHKIYSSDHFRESPEDAILEDMLTVEYVQSPYLLPKNFPLKPKHVDTDKPKENSERLVKKSSKIPSKRNIRGNVENVENVGEESSDVVFVKYTKNDHRSREQSPLSSGDRDRSFRRSKDRSVRRSGEISLRQSRERSMHREKSLPFRVEKSPSRGQSPFRGRERSPLRLQSRSRHRSPSPQRAKCRYVSPSFYRSLYRRSRSRSPRRRSSIVDRDRYHRSPSPLDRHRQRSSLSSRYGYRYRSPNGEIRRVGAIVQRSPSPPTRGRDSDPKYRKRSKSRERSPSLKIRRSRSSSRPRHEADTISSSKLSASVDDLSSKVKETERSEPKPDSAFIKEAKELEDRLTRDMKGYMEIPGSHPEYEDEWKRFWCAKYLEVQNEGKEDPLKYDYKSEWIGFWDTRLKQLFDEELKSKMKALKNKHRLPDNKQVEKLFEEVSSKSASKDENKSVLDVKTMWKELTGCDIKDDSTTNEPRSLSPWEDDDSLIFFKEVSEAHNNDNLLNDDILQPVSPDSLSSNLDPQSPRRNPFCQSPSRSMSQSQSAAQSNSDEHPFKKEYKKPSEKIHFENPLNVITVLRQLSVLEFQLGSYASHTISLLASGITMERVKPKSSLDLLTKENILFLELVKEKLKGQLLAGIVSKSMVKATLFAIKNVEQLLQVVPKLKPVAPPPIPVPPPVLLYGSAADQIGFALPDAGSLVYSSHVCGQHLSGYSNSFKHFVGKGSKHKEHDPFGQTSLKLMNDAVWESAGKHRRTSDEFPFRNGKPVAEAAPVAAVDNAIDKNLIAMQIAEVLTQQGRSDVSNEELQMLINTVIVNLEKEQKRKALQQNVPAQTTDVTISVVMNALAEIATVSNANLINTAAVSNASPAVPIDLKLNVVSDTTSALLQDARVNASVENANKPFAIDDLTEADIIEMLRNFKTIPRVKQEKLIEFLRKLEAADSERVEELRKYVNVL